MDKSSTQYKVRMCTVCPGETEYVCLSCACYLCSICKDSHVYDLKTIDHNVVLFRDQLSLKKKQDISATPNETHKIYHRQRLLPAFDYSIDYREHGLKDDESAYVTTRQHNRRIVHITNIEVLIARRVLLERIKTDVGTCQTIFSLFKPKLIEKAETIKARLNNVMQDANFNHMCSKQKTEMKRYLVRIQIIEHIYEYSSTRPIQFLRRKNFVSNNHATPYLKKHTSRLSIEKLNKKRVLECLSQTKINNSEKRRIENVQLMKLKTTPQLHQSLTVTDLGYSYHISSVTQDRIWVNNIDNLILADNTGKTIHNLKDLYSEDGVHTVNTESELFYIDKNYNINKLSQNMQTPIKFIETKDFPWKPQSVYCSLFSSDLLVGMHRKDNWTGKVNRYNHTGKLTMTIECDKTGKTIYGKISYITENNNGDIVVSDFERSVEVAECGGTYRFSYKGHPQKSGLEPRGICTDALSHILVCDDKTHTVQIIDKDGIFKRHLLNRPSGIFTPCSLSYDVSTHRLWVGSNSNNTVCVYRYIDRWDALSDQNQATLDVESNERKLEKENERPSTPKIVSVLHQPVPVKCVRGCHHISCVSSNRVWVSDWYNLILTDMTGEMLCQKTDLYGSLFTGSHTVNSESQLIYIDRKNNINMMSEGETITFIETDCKWKARCLYWSPSTKELLVGMYNEEKMAAKITKYNQTGKLKKAIQHDNTGLELFRKPNYITDNNNGDVVVSDYDQSGAVVVTDREGNHRFSYTGNPPGSGLQPSGICTDALSHILVCDKNTHTVQMINKDGDFLLNFPVKSQEIEDPLSLSYDFNTNYIWVGSDNTNKLCAYKYEKQHDVQSNFCPAVLAPRPTQDYHKNGVTDIDNGAQY